MRTFTCACGNTLYFENTGCLSCGRTVGFVPDARLLTSLNGSFEAPGTALHPRVSGQRFKACHNALAHNTCNWLIPIDSADEYCASCRLNDVVPNLDEPRRVQLWFEVEKAKRRALFTLLALGLPVVAKAADPSGLSFMILADERHDADVDATDERASTGHIDGTITISLAEADPSMREEMRERLNESYRTLLGHVRHEVGHYYWFRLVTDDASRGRFRRLFGDERVDYKAALEHHYSHGPPTDWQTRHVSAYASCHPWEDFAETWAHYMHIIDTLETANDAGFAIQGRLLSRPTRDFESQLALGVGPGQADFRVLLDDWAALSEGMNLLNRSMGLADAYPFALAPAATAKLEFVHGLIAGR